MDHGTLTDNNGRKADFRSVIIIMTTNAGAESLNKSSIGFINSKEAGDEMADIKRLFTPEFRNRLDATVSFKSLDEEIILRVVDKFLLQLEGQLAEKKVEVTFTDGLRQQLAKKGFDPLMGARPMQRLIQDTIRRALADELLFGRLVEGGRLTIDVDAEASRRSTSSRRRRATSRKRSRRRPESAFRCSERRGPSGPRSSSSRAARRVLAERRCAAARRPVLLRLGAPAGATKKASEATAKNSSSASLRVTGLPESGGQDLRARTARRQGDKAFALLRVTRLLPGPGGRTS
jgi:hypothetical protein